MSRLHDDALATLRGWQASDPGQDRLRQEYVAHLESHPDAMTRDSHPAHLTAGALVLSADHSRVLMTLHAKARRWFHLGGHCEPRDQTLSGAALREGTEESGIDDLTLDPVPVHLDAHVVGFCGQHERVRHLDVRFLALAPPDAVAAVSNESLDVRWWPVDGLPTDEPALRELVRLGVQRAQASSAAI
ncbi:MAG: NUDIX domain-containing protein [Nocardioidaceae bacterium]